MKIKSHPILLTILFYSWAVIATAQSLGSYTIDGTFDGCNYKKFYPLVGGGILECQEYKYFYHYRPEVIAKGRNVLLIDDKKIRAYIHDGNITSTRVDGEFEGCDFDTLIPFTNGLIFECSTYSYSYSYMPEVKIFNFGGGQHKVMINNQMYDGRLYRR